MACIITYNSKKYTQSEFNEYFKSHFLEFAGYFLGSKKDVEGFRQFMESSSTPSTGEFLEQRFSRYLIKEIGAIRQESVCNHIARTITKEIIANPNRNINDIRNEVLARYKQEFIEDRDYFESSDEVDKDRFLEFYNPLINNFDTVARIVNTKVQKINNLIGEVNDDLEIDLVEVEDNEKINSDKSAYETKVTLSAEIKRLFADIDAPNKNILGEQDVMDYTLVDAAVKGIVSNLPQDYEIMKAKMLENKEAYPWITQLVSKLDNSGEKIQNMFVTEMNHHYVKHYMAMWQKVGNKFELSMVMANENAIEGQIVSNWKSNLTSGNSVDVNGVLVKRDELLKRYDSFQESKNPEEVRAWLNDLGISIGDKSWNDIVNGNYVFKSKDGKISFEKFISSDYSPVVHLAKKLKSIGNSSVEEFDIYADSSIGKLAKHEARFTTQVLSNSHRAGGKTVYSYGKNKYIVDFVRELKQSNLAKDILDKSGSFNSESIILKAFLDKDISFTENFEVSTVSLQALKKFGSKDKDGLELNNLGEDEYEIQELSGLYSPQQDVTSSNKRVGLLNFLTCSDKSTAMIVRTVLQNIGFNSDATLNSDSINKIYTQCVLPEIKRIKQWENMVETNTKFTNSEFKNGGHMFHLIPSLNNLEGMWNSDGTININVESVEFRNSIENEIKRLVDKLVQDKLALWEKYGITKNGQAELLDFRTMQSFKLLEGLPKEFYPKAMATDMVYQYMLGNANFFTGIVGDPAKFYKSKVYKKSVQELIKNDSITLKQSSDIALVWSKLTPEQRIKTIQEVYDNVGKRLAMYIAPGKSTADYEGEVSYIFVKDKMVDSLNLEQYKALLGEDKAKDYSKKGTLEEGTNAQEFTTFLEHLYVMDKSGLLPTGFYREIKDIVSNEISKGNFYYTQAIKDKLSEESLKFFNDKLVCQVMKPVYSWFTVDETGVTPMYIKTSSYPLLPELTANKELDKVRIMMEKNGLQRLSFPSGTKLGMPTEPVVLWDENGNARENISSEEILKGKKVLPRMGFRLQQEVPYDALKDYINRVSQADKNLFINLLDIEGFEYNGQRFKGSELQKIYEDYYGQLYKLGFDELVDELSIKFDEAGNVVEFDKKALKDILLEEAVKRDYALNDIEALDLDEALDYIAFMPSANKYEALLNAIVKNRVLQMKFKGKSFVLSTEEGYQSITGESALDGVIYTDKWQGTLDPGHFEDSNGNKLTGEELKKAWKDGTAIVKRPAQVLMPWKFKDDNGKLHIEDFVNKETGRIDTAKLPEELMQLFGMRIPNQGPNSQSWIEVAGFLPKKSGDIIIATRDYLAQMGSDFDVDKFYTYMYNYSIKNGKLKKVDYTSKDVIRDEARRNELWRQSLQNKLLDIHLALHKNTDKTVQYQISRPIGFWKFKEIADEIAATQHYNPDFTALSDDYQRTKRLNASKGKTLVGDFSNLSMFNAAAQGKNLYLRKNNGERVFVRFGNIISNGDLSDKYTISTRKSLENNSDLDVSEITFKSEVIEGLQSSAVDNEKEQILDKLNMDSQSSRYSKLLAQLGFENEVAYFMRQPIIVDYFNELKRLRSSLGAYTPNAEELAENFVMEKYKTSSFNDKLYDENFAKGKGLSSTNMKNSIINPDANFNYIQIAAFEQMQYLKKYADDLQAIQSAINTDSKGLDKSLFETLSKEDAVDNMNQKSIANTDALLDNTINGFATDNGLRLNNKLWSNLFPYRQHGIVALFETIEKTINKSDVGIGTRATLRSNIWKEFKSYMFSLKELGLHGDVDIKAERERLFIDSESNKSLASKVKEIQKLPEFVNHPFLSRLVPVTSKGIKPSIIKMNTGIDPSAELLIVQAATDLYVNDRKIHGLDMTTKQLFEELVKASYLSGGIQEFVQYIKYMPVAYLFDKGFTESISNKVRTKFFEDLDKLDIPGQDAPYWALPTFVIQYLQHDQRGVQTLPKVGYENDIKIMSSDKSHVTSVKVEKFSLMNSDYYIDTKNGQKPPVALVIPSTGRVKGLDDNVLFLHTGEKDSQGYPIYTRLSNKGSFAFSEYNFGVKYDRSSIESYNSISELKELETRYPENKDVSDTFENPEHKEIQVRDILGIVDAGNIENVKSIINNIAVYSDDTFQQELAKEFNKHMDKLSVNFSTNLHRANAAGSFWNNTVYVNMDVDANKSLSGLSQTILHEVTHGFVNNVLEQYESNPSFLSGDTKKAVADLKRLQSIYISRTKKKFGDRFNEISKAIKDVKYELIKDRGDLLEVYAANPDKLQEFTALTISNPEIQKVLNEIDDPNAKERALLDRFVDIVKNLLNSIGFDIKEGKLLEGAIQDILVIIKGDNNVEAVAKDDFLEYASKFSATQLDTSKPPVDTGKQTFTYDNRSVETDFILGEEQSQAIKDLIDFAKNGNKDHKFKNVFTLSGAAGTGKTAIIGYLQKYLVMEGYSFAYMAPTHAATAQLAFATVKTGNKQLPATIASSITTNPKTGEFIFTAKIKGRLGYRPIIVIDEASMVGIDNINKLLEAAKNAGAKVIFMGDEKQIPEVSAENLKDKPVSPAFSMFKKTSLTKVFRQTNNSLLNILTETRKQTGFKLFKPDKNSSAVKFLKTKDFNEELISTVKADPENTAVISYTNSSVKSSNKNIREVLGRGENTEVGDIIVGYLGYASKQIEKGHLANSVSYTINNIEKSGSVATIFATSSKLSKLKKDGILNIVPETRFRYYQLSHDDSLKIDGITDDDLIENNSIVAGVFSEINDANNMLASKRISYGAYLDMLRKFSEDLSTMSVGADYVYNPASGKMEKYSIGMHRGIKTTGQGSLLFGKDVDYGHAITIHKSQGVTIDNVFFKPGSLSSAPNIIIKNKEDIITTEKQSLAYVAMSRSSKKLVVEDDGAISFTKLSTEDVVNESNDIERVSEDFLPATNSKEQTLRDANELNSDGTSKKYIMNDTNYKRVFKKAQDINKSQAFYKATVGTTYGEDVIRSGRQYYYIRLEQREISIKEKMNTISDAQIFERLRNCR